MHNFYALISHIVEVLKKRFILFFIILALFLGLYSFFFALFTIPMPDGVLGFYRMTPPTLFEYFYMSFSSLVSAVIVTLTFHRIHLETPNEEEKVFKKRDMKGKIASVLGVTTGVFGAVCPACLGINFLLLGNVFTAQLSFLIPYIFWIQFGGIAFLFVGLYFVTKSSYEKKCLSCNLKTTEKKDNKKNKNSITMLVKNSVNILVFLVVGLLIFQVSYAFSLTPSYTGENKKITNINKEVKKTIEEVVPAQGFIIKAKWGNVISKMVRSGALDPVKLENILKERYKQKMKPEWRAILAGKNENLKINSDNAIFMMYILWTLSKNNKNQILFDSPFVKYFKNYDIGVGKAGYGNEIILQLTPKQQQVAKEVAENSNRPCCNNSTAAPDCSHGYSALGLVELMASQNFSKEEIFSAFVKFNSFWFPDVYVKNALYFKLVKGKNWNQVNKETIAGKDYSSLRGAYKVKNYLKENYDF